MSQTDALQKKNETSILNLLSSFPSVITLS